MVVTIVLLVLYRHNALDELVESAESQNVTLARSFANILWPNFADYVTSISEVDGDTLRARPETRELGDSLRTLTAGLPVLKVKIYNLNGLTVYSSQPSQIGSNKSNNQGFLKSAREGKPASKLSFRDTFSAFSGTVENRDIVESYLPIWGRDGAIEAVFELYTDVTPLMARIEQRTTKLMIAIAVIFGLFYAVLFLIIRRADRILKRQYVDLMDIKENMGEKNAVLEHEVAERKRVEAALREAHSTLERRVDERTMELKHNGEDLARLADDLRLARDEARGADRAKSEFLAAMSHELRTPLNAVIGFSEVIKSETFGPVGNVQYRDYANDIHDSGQHLLGLINDILDLSKIESGIEEIFEDTIDILAVVRATMKLVTHRAEQDGIKLDMELREPLPALRADARKLKQILVNLLSNAVKFTPAGGEVTLRVWCRKDSGYVFQIADTGIGIALKNIPKALSRFGQIDADLNRQFEGTGLGLPLTKALVEQHGGSLDLQSELGVGTTVTVRFPAERIFMPLNAVESLYLEDKVARRQPA